MLIGEYKHVLDGKKRISLPAKFRKELGKKLVITRGLDSCLFIYPLKEWQVITEKLTTLSIGKANQRSFNRFFLAGAVEIDVDSAGRILIPDFLKSFAHLKTNVVITGVHSRLEVWDEKAWRTYNQNIEQKADVLAETLGEIGVL